MRVRLVRPLLLGLVARTFSPPKDARRPSGYQWGIGPETTVEGIDRDRIEAMFSNTSAGPELGRLVRQLGSLGWAELTDGDLRSQSEIYTDSSRGYVELIRVAARIAVLAEAARAELAPAEWEVALRMKLEAVASEHRLEMSSSQFTVTGTVRSSKVAVRLVATDRYLLVFKATLPVTFPAGSCVVPRSGMWSKLATLVGIDRPTDDGEFNTLFEVKGALRGRLARHAAAGLRNLSRTGELRVEHDRITYRTISLDVDVVWVINELASIAEGITDAVSDLSGAPYRRRSG